jgi:hypothetical protein
MTRKTRDLLQLRVASSVYRRQLLMIVLCSLLSACSPQLRMMKEPSAEQIPDYRWAATAPDGLTVTIHTVLVRNGPGSWVRDADWDEYILTIKNSSMSPMKIEALRLYSPYLPDPQQSSLDLQLLENQSRETLKNVRDVAVVAGAGAFGRAWALLHLQAPVPLELRWPFRSQYWRCPCSSTKWVRSPIAVILNTRIVR